MNRRGFLLTSLAGVLAAPLAAEAQRSKTPVIGVLSPWGPSLRPAGHVQNLARPGGNVTGLSIMPQGRMEPKQLELLKEAVPGLTYVGVLANRIMGDPATVEISAAAGALGLRLQTFEVSSPEEIPNAFRAISQAGVGAVLVRPDPLVLDPESAQSATLASKYRLPAIYPRSGVPTRYGGLMSYNADLYDIHRRSASYVDRILKGTPPRDLPVEQPIKFDFVINLKTAKALGLTIPPALLGRADEVIQ
jgi:ABC-type uncharacterized transport system substrate-binding protein